LLIDEVFDFTVDDKTLTLGGEDPADSLGVEELLDLSFCCGDATRLLIILSPDMFPLKNEKY
jgi:hypothetical protein